jgi:anti-sigma factor RsiW
MMPMKTECANWKDALLNATLAGSSATELEDHLARCPECARELARLRARQQQIDTLLPLVARGAEPQPGFETRVLAAAAALNASHPPRSPKLWMRWAFAGVMAALVIGLAVYRRPSQTLSQEELMAAQKLAQWRAPSDALLQLPGQQIMRTTPKFGESYLNIPSNKEK